MIEPPDQWLPLPEAAIHLGIAENALRSRIKRRTIRARKDNHGRLMVCLSGTVDRTRTMVRSRFDPGSDHTIEPPPEPPQSRQDASDMIPASVLRETVSLLREAQREATALLLERIDGAELRAEAAEARAAAVEAKLGQVLDRLIDERRPWWSRWLGQSKRSDLGDT